MVGVPVPPVISDSQMIGRLELVNAFLALGPHVWKNQKLKPNFFSPEVLPVPHQQIIHFYLKISVICVVN